MLGTHIHSGIPDCRRLLSVSPAEAVDVDQACSLVSVWIHWCRVNIFERSEVFDRWMASLADMKTRARILRRIDSAILGNFGDCQYIAEGVYEMRIHFGPGYRVYYVHRRQSIYLLLVGGDKGSQTRDIRKALEMSRDL